MLGRTALIAAVLFTVEAAPPNGRNECDTGADGQCIGSRSSALLQAVRAPQERQALFEAESVDELGQMHAQSLLHLDTLAKLKNGDGELPDTVRTLLITIKNHSEKVHAKLSAEHTTQKSATQAKFNAIAACESHLGVVTTANSDNSSSLKSLAAQALQGLCSCRLTQAQKDADSTGCEDQLACYLSNRDSSSLNTHLRKADGTARELYEDPTDMCANSDAWENAAGSSDADKAVTWLTSQKSTWNSALDAKIATIQNLQTQYNQWHAKYEALKDGTGAFQGKGCGDLKSIKTTQDNTCSLKQAQATLRQCVYSEEVKNGCDQYTVCRTAAVTAWTTKKNEQNVSSRDRRDAWVSASQIMCLVDKLLSNTTSAACSDTCDANCANNTDLSAILTRSYADATTCTVPDKSCDSWTPTCSASGWSTYTAAYLIGNRTTGCEGSPAAAALTMPAGDTCQACGNIAMCDSFTCQVGHTNRGFNVRCPGGVCNATTCCQAPAPTETPTDSPTGAPTADPNAPSSSLSENEWTNKDGITVTKSNGVLTFPSKTSTWFRNTAIGTNGLLQPPYEVWWEVRRILPSGNGGWIPVCSNTKDQKDLYKSGTFQWRHNANSWGINPGGKLWNIGSKQGDTRSDPWPATEHWYWQGTSWGADKTVKIYFGKNNQTREEVKAAGPWIDETAPSELNGECYMWFWPYHNTPYEMRNFIVE